MFFLKWWNPSTWLSDVNVSVVGSIVKALRTLFYEFATMLYKLIISLYNLFEALCYGRLLDSTTMTELSTRVGLVLGLIMLFYVIFSFIKMMIDPDTFGDKTKGATSIVKRVILVIVMLGLSNFVFEYLFSIQRFVIHNHVISKVFLPYSVDTENFGSALSAELFISFFDVESSLKEYADENTNIGICQQEVYTLKDRIYKSADFKLGLSCLNESTTVIGEDGKDTEVTIIDFNWLLSLGVALVIIYLLVTYCIMVGVRMIQLALLEIISPMAIVSYLAPKQDTMFTKWTKLYFSTYIDVFLRVAIINFIVFLIAVILGNEGDWYFWESIGSPTDPFTIDLIEIAMILALLTFAKKAPDLIKQLFPGGASKLGLGVSSPKNFFDSMVGGNILKNIPKRAYGTAAVGLGVASGNLRRSIGKIMDLDKYDKDIVRNGRYDQTRLNTLRDELHKAEEMEDDMAVAALSSEIAREEQLRDEHNSRYNTELEKKKAYEKNLRHWIGRGVTGTLRGVAGGGIAGMRTTDKKGRQAATKTGIDRTNADWKLQDAGYGVRQRVNDTARGVFYRDTHIGQMGEASDYHLQALQNELAQYQKELVENNVSVRNIQVNKLGDGYVLYNDDGTSRVIDASELSVAEARIASLNKQIGTEKGRNKALHQRENEKKN